MAKDGIIPDMPIMNNFLRPTLSSRNNETTHARTLKIPIIIDGRIEAELLTIPALWNIIGE